MILTCPNCDSQFKVNPQQIPAEGREVRCASCKHQWHAYPEGVAAELKPPEPEVSPEEEAASQEPSLIAFPDPQPADSVETQEDDSDIDSLLGDGGDDLPEDAFEDDSDVIRDEAPTNDQNEPEQLISPIEKDDYGFAGLSDDQAEALSPAGPKRAPVAPLAVIAALLAIAVFATSLIAAPKTMQGPFGFLYAMMGAERSDGLVLSHLQLRERPSRKHARFILEGKIINETETERVVPLVRVAMIDQSGKVMNEREYRDMDAPTIAPGETYNFKASNLETEDGEQLAYFLIDIGNGAELRLRKASNGGPNG